ncbi:hypothetical protein Q8A67_010968 [Cirrhinus molitorella]|uniref:Uncharacterized protein n=1 Tax=Cirrhinus molitorella TaxID=172907 RepID=A0AA88TLQ1_9TELE|nr:hypothetical protein Q8A67_010968 [Cirrhinus molitorella]
MKRIRKLLGNKKTAGKKSEEHRLVEDKRPTHHTETTDGEQESTVDFGMPSGSGVDVSDETVLHILRTILSGQSNPPAMAKINFSKELHHKCLQEIDQSVENKFPSLPKVRPQGSQEEQTWDFLQRTQSMIYDEVLRLTPFLKDAGLLDHLKDNYSRHIFTNLDLLLNGDLSVKELFLILLWGKDLFFSSESKLTVYDPLLLTGGFERAKQKLLQKLKNYISTTLQNILHYDEEHGHTEDNSKETFNSVHIDVIQCLNCAILEAEKVGLTLMHAVQILCSGELHGFVQKYVDAENKRLKIQEENFVYLFRIINTCTQLRCYAKRITPDKNNSDVYSSTIHMLQKLEDNASSTVQKIMNSLAQDNLESYFKERNRHIDILMEAIQRKWASLPETASEIKAVVVKIAYDSVSKVYLECLMKTKFRNLEECWENAEEKIKEDVQYFHETFSDLNGIVAQENQLLQRMSEVIHSNEEDALKITCCDLFKDFPQESKQYVPGLLRWKGVLSERQVREVLDVVRENGLRKTRKGNEEKLLMKKTEKTDGEQASESSSQQSGVPDLIILDAEARNKIVLDTLRKILSDQSTPEDFDYAVEMSKTMSKLNSSFSQDWLCKYLQEIDQFVERHFPTLPAEGPQESKIPDFLKSAESMIYDEVHRLTPVLKNAGLLVHLMDSYSHHLFTKLDLLLNRDLSVKEIFCLLLWGKKVFFSPDSQHFLRVDDPLLLTGWFERAKGKLLPKLQNDISTTLQNILCYDEQHGHNEDSMDEETFIRVHLDVTQCLNAVIQSSKEFSHTLMCTAQTLCLKQLYRFVQEYVYAEKERLEKQQNLKKNSVLFRLISTCRQLRFFAPQLNNSDMNNSDILSEIICMLEELEDHVLSVVQKMMKHLAQASLRCYFEEEGDQINILTEAIKKQCASLPQTAVGKEIQEIFVNVANDCVSRVYLDCLMKSKFRRLEKRWGNVGEWIREDALNLHNTFTELNFSDEKRSSLLHRMSEVLLCNDVEALKITCCDLFRDFPQDSEQYLPGLLRWKMVLSEQQVKEVLDVRRLSLDDVETASNEADIKKIVLGIYVVKHEFADATEDPEDIAIVLEGVEVLSGLAA